MAMDEIDQMAGGSIETTYIQLTQLIEGKKELEAAKAEIEEGKNRLPMVNSSLMQLKRSWTLIKRIP